MERIVRPELLDVLPPQDHRALRSRRDLRRINAWMRHPRVMARILQKYLPDENARQIVELGAGDGHFLLSVAGRLQGRWPGAEVTLVDRLDVFDPQTRDQFESLGWRVHAEIAEASEWLRQAPPNPAGTIVSNLFLHQFQTEQLAELLRLAARSARVVIALEPRRAWLPRLCSRLLWVIGCGPVTCHDGHISIRAGFSGGELSALWPDKNKWELVERSIDPFNHLFIARRKD
jgi:DNA-binding PucR family transcriptional regulator